MTDPKVEQAKLEHMQALADEQNAQSHLDKFARTTPLSPTEDVEATDGDALREAIERKRAATEHRQKTEEKYHRLRESSE